MFLELDKIENRSKTTSDPWKKNEWKKSTNLKHEPWPSK